MIDAGSSSPLTPHPQPGDGELQASQGYIVKRLKKTKTIKKLKPGAYPGDSKIGHLRDT